MRVWKKAGLVIVAAAVLTGGVATSARASQPNIVYAVTCVGAAGGGLTLSPWGVRHLVRECEAAGGHAQVQVIVHR